MHFIIILSGATSPGKPTTSIHFLQPRPIIMIYDECAGQLHRSDAFLVKPSTAPPHPVASPNICGSKALGKPTTSFVNCDEWTGRPNRRAVFLLIIPWARPARRHLPIFCATPWPAQTYHMNFYSGSPAHRILMIVCLNFWESAILTKRKCKLVCKIYPASSINSSMMARNFTSCGDGYFKGQRLQR